MPMLKGTTYPNMQSLIRALRQWRVQFPNEVQIDGNRAKKSNPADWIFVAPPNGQGLSLHGDTRRKGVDILIAIDDLVKTDGKMLQWGFVINARGIKKNKIAFGIPGVYLYQT